MSRYRPAWPCATILESGPTGLRVRASFSISLPPIMHELIVITLGHGVFFDIHPRCLTS